ncbi:DUF2812 domain-containing protein [Romboutsia lituseburensis]|uniref:DUF2812 domain-containing protein n=1 Tax=Romboutsia lituseburensis TaxID=1537 RepID=UPI00215A32DB|nr:DUF2812 domain-containing protein [Romboutsia lituseburensis]MCR8747068.1 DUF2812 domain-containing protein [Romboutsia lituseburensis]
MSKYKKVFKMFVIGEEEKECKWLEEMSKKGYHLVNVRFACHYTFEKTDSQDYSYMIDMRENNSLDEGEYLAIYEDYGLEYVDKSKDFYYFRSKDKNNMKHIKHIEQGRYADRLKSQSKLLLIMGLLNVLIGVMGILHTFSTVNTQYIEITYINLIIGIAVIYIFYANSKKIKRIESDCTKVLYKTTLKDWRGFYPLFIICIFLIFIYGILTIVNI